MFEYNSRVSDEEFNLALSKLEEAIAKKDTPEEWAQFASRILVFVGKIGINQAGLGPVVQLIENIFKDDADIIVEIIKKLGE